MTQSRFTGLHFYCMVFFLVSCSGGGNGNKTGTDSTMVDSTKSAAVPETTTIITAPQNMMVAKHKVLNYAKWKSSYDEHDSFRIANGIHSYVIGRGLQDTNMILVAVKVDDMAKTKAFAKDPNLKKAMQKGGVIGTPLFSFVTMTFQDTAAVSSDLRSRTTFTVKDWGAWQKAFEEGKQERIDNGITVRAFGHDADDDKKVELVTALLDTAKAYAYYKSDMLKKRRAAGGVIGEPERFLFRVVQRY
ncbi:hypothetical protein Q4E93_09685 [Flavitalea sp. BT771]|uniref:hypothetical protein n=1 Tax=Flavitalea sp. BT771 TaxID=3063329 RepID=UPI0026E19C3F|nr:hypothetical protein [Flavitalea sp. BT771]MDO6430861.1 hypothetical protein [Flavitalea sp. BT771]MDV6218999.1 hypothetical protein [Flavitalea sp. BT771]